MPLVFIPRDCSTHLGYRTGYLPGCNLWQSARLPRGHCFRQQFTARIPDQLCPGVHLYHRGSFHQLAAVKMAYALLPDAESDINTLHGHIAFFKQKLNINSEYTLLPSDSAIQCIVLNSNEKARQAAEKLQAAGFDVRPIFSPTVPAGAERIRICIHSFNTLEQISSLTSAINNILHAN
jgi:hypothetical protein